MLDEDGNEVEDTGDDEGQQQTGDEQEQQSNQMSTEGIQNIIQTTMEGMRQQAPQQQQQAPMTQEQINERLNVYNFTPESGTQMREALMAEEFNPAQFAGMMNEMLNGVSKQHSTYAELVSQAQLQQQMQQIQPGLTAAQEVQQERRENTFFKTYKSLEPYKAMLPGVSQQVAASGQRFATTKQANEAVAKAAEVMIKQMNPTFKLNNAQANRKPARTTFPGGGGGGRSAASQGNAASIWDR